MGTHQILYRSRSNRMLAGVAGGIAEYFNIDPTIIRLVFLVLTIAGGAGVLVYAVGWIIIPEAPLTPQEAAMPEPDETKTTTDRPATHDHRHYHERSPQGRMLGGIILIGLGVAFFIQETIGFDVWRYAWPMILIIIGLFIIMKRR